MKNKILSICGIIITIVCFTSLNNIQATTISPPIKLTDNATSGFVGDSIRINGTGFPQVGSTLTITFDNIPLSITSGTLLNQANGFNFNIKIPNTTAGVHEIMLSDPQGNNIIDTFTIIPRMAINSNIVSSGSIVTISGTGFDGNPFKQLTLKLDSLNIQPSVGSLIQQNYGNFTISFSIPNISKGTHTIFITDPSFNNSQVQITIK